MLRGAFVLLLLMTSGLSWAQEGAPAIHNKMSATPERPSAEQIWSNLMQGNRRFVTGKARPRDVQRQRAQLLKGQHPNVVVLSCSDSRVPPELIFDAGLGELFVVRAAGNIADAVGLGSIEYAAEHLGSSVLVVLGHEKCGAVTAACSESHVESPNLKSVLDKIGPAVTEARKDSDSSALVETAIQENIHQSAEDLLANSAVLRRALKEHKLTIFEAIYRLQTGEVTRLGKLSLVSPAYKLDVGDVVRTD